MDRSRRRKALGVSILVLWAGALGWHAKRLYLRPDSARLAEAARTLPPGPAYYAVFRGDGRIGWAESRIDTLPSGGGFLLSDRLQVDLSSLGFGDTTEVRSEAELGPALRLRWFTVEAEGALGTLSAEGEMEGDSVLVIRVERPDGTRTERISVEEGIVLSTALPLRLAAEGGQPGDRFEMRTFDPMRLGSRSVEVEVLDRSFRTYADSADQEEATGRWREARRDTVLAWKVARDLGELRLTSWIDEDGRYLEVDVPGGFRLERTAFELAYFGRAGGDTVTGEGRRREESEP